MPQYAPANFATPDPYGAEQISIERQRRLADALQMQSQQPLDVSQSAGGWAIPVSPLSAIAKVLQGGVAGMAQKKGDTREQALASKYQSDLSQALVNAQQAAGPHQEAVDTSGEGTGSMDMSGSANPPQQMVPGSREKMIQALMAHPATRPIAMQQMQQDLQMQGFMQAGQGTQSGNPMVPGGPQSSVMAGSGTTPAQGALPQGFGGPAGGSPMAVWLRSDPSGKAYLEALSKDYIEANKPQNVRPEGTIALPDGKGGYRQAYYSAKVGEGQTRDASGAASLVTNYLQNQAALGKTPLTEVTNADQTKSYVPNAQLAGAAMANPLPVPGAAPPAAVGPNPNNVGNLRPQGASTGFQQFASPAEGLAAVDKNLQAYGAKGINTIEGVVSRWAPPSENNTAAYIADVSKRLGVDPKQPLDMQNPAVRQALGTAIMLHEKGPALFAAPASQAGPPRFGQTQEQQIQQTRQTAAGKAVDENFAKDYVAFTTAGGSQDAMKQIAQLGDVVDKLKNPANELTGPIRGQLPDAVRNITNPQAVAMRERVEEVVQRSLRAILGAQFTENEGKRLIARAYNPAMSQEENAIRVGRLATQLQQAFAAKQDAAQYFEKNGTLMGWQGKLPTASDFDPEAVVTSGRIGPSNSALEAALQKYGR